MTETREERAARFEAEHRREQRLAFPSRTCAGVQFVLAGSHVWRSMNASVPTGANVAEHWDTVARFMTSGLAGLSLLGLGCLLAFRSRESCGACLLANVLAFACTASVVLVCA